MAKSPRKSPPPDSWTEARVFEALKGPFPDGAYVRVPQVRNGTGYSGSPRTADALVVSCWPSRGLWFAGVEIKVSLSDWRRELARPGKSAEIQQWCNYWYVAAPAGLVPIGELPPTWGLLECSARGCKVAKAAPRLKPKAPDAAFVCAVLRAAIDGMVPTIEVSAMADKLASDRAADSVRQFEKLREDVKRFEAAVGVSITHTWDYGNVTAAINLLRKSEFRGLEALAEYMRCEANRMIKTAVEVISICDEALKVPGPVKPDSEKVAAVSLDEVEADA